MLRKKSPSLVETLNRDVLGYICEFLDPKDICQLGSTCKIMKSVSENDNIWLKLLPSTFGANWRDFLPEDELEERLKRIRSMKKSLGTPAKPAGLFMATFIALWATTSNFVRDTSEVVDPAMYDILLKVALLGNAGVGKSSLLYCARENTFIDYHTCGICVDFCILRWKAVDPTLYSIPAAKVKAQIWDTAGQERFGRISRSYFRNMFAIAVCFSVDDRESFEAVSSRWIPQIKEFAMSEVKIVLIACKFDLPVQKHKVSSAEGRKLAAQLGVIYVETSAKTGFNVNKAFDRLVTKGVEAYDKSLLRREAEAKALQAQQATPAPVPSMLTRVSQWIWSWNPWSKK